jgi:hypothetical protein
MANVAERYPQTAYTGMQKSLPQEWQFLQRVIVGLGMEFDDIEQALDDKFLLALFGIESVSDTKRQLVACLPVKQHSWLALSNPTTTVRQSRIGKHPLWYVEMLSPLSASERTDFRSADQHVNIMAQGKAEIRKRSQEAYGKSIHGDYFIDHP